MEKNVMKSAYIAEYDNVLRKKKSAQHFNFNFHFK